MRVQIPPGLRKSGIPDSVLIPAPVKTTARRARAITRGSSALSGSLAMRRVWQMRRDAPSPACDLAAVMARTAYLAAEGFVEELDHELGGADAGHGRLVVAARAAPRACGCGDRRGGAAPRRMGRQCLARSAGARYRLDFGRGGEIAGNPA